ncbi:MAG: hypothetical protein J1F67_06105 [Muribaculaceae bacterium]|nr:hypothetical protein [Muribaculaceae bacterium]
MSIKFQNSCFWLAELILVCFVISCKNEEYDKSEYNEDKLYTVAINFSTTGTRASSSLVSERIKSFRIIITSKVSNSQEEGSDVDGTPESSEIVQLNKFVTEENLACAFNYYLLWHTDAGTKNFYLFANEESVGNLSYANGSSSETSLSTLLNSYKAGTKVSDLKSILTSAYFTPEYHIDDSGSIYLPYTSIYEGIEVTKPNDSLEMNLVPVATKFIFNFINYRSNYVYVNEISIKSTNTENYLFANVGEKNMQMTLSGETLYWVEWLAKISKLSHYNDSFGPNQSFNTLYGWIWDYQIPTNEENNPYVFLASENQLSISGISYPEADENDDDNETEEAAGIPGKNTAGPFYVPESKLNLSQEYVSSDESDEPVLVRETQKYYLTISLEEDSYNLDIPDFTEVEIDNLKALFRNTSVIINLVMRQGDIEIYGEIAPWNEQSVNGYVTEGNAPANNPF